jgi:signal transduction histidine kinase
MRQERSVSPWAIAVLVVVTAFSVGAFLVIRQGIDRQKNALLRDQASQIDLLLQSDLQNVQTELKSLAYFTASSGNSPAVFATQAKPLLTNPAASVALVDISSGQPKVVLDSGKLLHGPGSALSEPLARAASAATTNLSSGIVHTGSSAIVYVAATSSIYPSVVALEVSPIAQNRAVPNKSGPYSRVYVNIYEGQHADHRDLLVTTFGSRPLPRPVATSTTKVGAVTWLTQVSAKTALVGSYAEGSPWIALAVGLILAVALTILVTTLSRRNRYVARLVEDRTAELVDAQKALVRNERLAAVGEMATVVGHELRNPLGAAINNLFLVRTVAGDALDEEAKQFVLNAEHQIHRAAQLSEELTAYMREREPKISSVELETVLTEAVHSAPPPDGIEVDVQSTATLEADPSLIAQVLTNLLTNAYDAMPEGGRIEIAAGHDDGYSVISVRDTGSGFDPKLLERLFDPFFTTKSEGAGLGLAIVQRLVEAHQGTVSIENVNGGGARVSVRIPHDTSKH